MLGGIGWGLVSQSARDNSYVLTTVSLILPRQIAEMAGADPPFFQKGACKYESSGQTFQGQRNGRGGMGERVRVRVMSEHVDFFIWISEEFEVIFISGRLPRQLHGDHCTIRESLFSFCLETPYLLTDRVFSIYVPHFQGIWEMNCVPPSMPSTSSSSCDQTSSKTSQRGGCNPLNPPPWIPFCMDTEVRARPLVIKPAQEEENPSCLVSSGVKSMIFFKALAKEVHETTRNTSWSPGYWKAGNWQVLLSDKNNISGRYHCVLGQ